MILVTGATGFIGKRFIRILANKYPKDKILCLTWSKKKKIEGNGRKILKELKIKFIQGDLVTKRGLDKLPQKPEIIFHLAANTHTDELDHRVNDVGTKNLLEAVGPLDKNSLFVHVSTTMFVGGRKNCKNPVNENTKPFPTNEYTRTKLEAERYLRQKAKAQGFRLAIVRFPTVYGKNPREKSLFDFLKELIEKGSLLARPNWPGLTGLIHVDDAAKAIFLSSKIKIKPRSSETILFSAENLTLAQISKILHEAMGYEYNEIKIPKFVWSFFQILRRYVYLLEPFLPPGNYNLVWRASLIVDHVFNCNSSKAHKLFPNWRFKKLEDSVTEIL